MFEVHFRDQLAPMGVEVFIECYLTGHSAKWFASRSDLVDNPTVFFGDARHALTLMAKELAEVQANLIQADAKDAEAAAKKYMSGYGSSSFRMVSSKTGALVHGKHVDKANILDPVYVDIEPFDIAVGKSSKVGTVWKKLDDYKFDFMLQNPNEADISPGTSYILQKLQDVAKDIEDWYKKDISPVANALPVKAAPYPEMNKNTHINKNIMKPQQVQALEEQIKKSIIETAQAKQELNITVPPDISFQTDDKNLPPGMMEIMHVPEEQSIGHEYHIVFTNSQGERAAAPLDKPEFRTMERKQISDPYKPGEQVVEIRGGVFRIKDAVLIEGDSPLAASSTRAKNAKNPNYWAHQVEDKVNGIKQQVVQNLPEDDSTRALICMISDLLSDHIYNMQAPDEEETQEP